MSSRFIIDKVGLLFTLVAKSRGVRLICQVDLSLVIVIELLLFFFVFCTTRTCECYFMKLSLLLYEIESLP